MSNSGGGEGRASFSGKLGYVLATAGSAVGLGNIWRFPYLAARYGGGIFLLVYLVLAFTIGYALMISEETIGRMTQKSSVSAFRKFGNTLQNKFGGWINAIIPALIAPYYSVIGGWVVKYLYEYIVNDKNTIASPTYFNDFIANPGNAELFFVIFAALVIVTILGGVKRGIESASKFMMPVLLILAIFVAIYSSTRPGAWEGVKYMLIPNFKDFSFMTLVAGMGQMFFSLSLAMGILYTYGSYMKRDINVESATIQVIVLSSIIAVLGGLMVIPSVFAYYGGKPSVMNAGASLMFITLPKVFASMGLGKIVGIMFFLLVLFAALTSAISLAETIVATLQDELGWGRGKASAVTFGILIVLGTLSSLGYSVLKGVTPLGLTMLDFFDFITNSIMMPIAAFTTCLLVLRSIGLKTIEEEVRISSNFRLAGMYNVITRYIAPICLIIIFLSSVMNAFGIIHI